MAWVSLTNAVLLLLQLLQCLPVDYNWLGWRGDYDRPYKCLNLAKLAYTAGAFSIAQDLVIIVLPLPLLARLQTSWRARLGIMLMFSLGIFVFVTSCVRLDTLSVFNHTTNPTWDYLNTVIWTALEISVAILVANLPAIRAFLARAVPGLFSSRGTASGTTSRKNKSGFTLTSSREATQSSRSRNLFAARRGNDSFDGNESQIELGDTIHGNVQTEIGVEGKVSRQSTLHSGDDTSTHGSEEAVRPAAWSTDLEGHRSADSTGPEAAVPRIRVYTTTTTRTMPASSEK